MAELSLSDATIISSVVHARQVGLQRKLELLERASDPARRIGRYLIDDPMAPALTGQELETAEQIRRWTDLTLEEA